MVDKRFIEEDFPVKEVSRESEKEKNIRHGHISTLHIWWARRPLASSRATNYAALIPAPKNEQKRREKLKFIAELSKWENSLNREIIERARRDILEYFKQISDNPNQERPRVLDPFAGGGAIPLEALRLGCETYASDYNPVAVLILKATLEYPQKYGRKNGGRASKEKPLDEYGIKAGEEEKYDLVRDVEKWGKWVLEEAKKELERFYPKDEDGSVPVGYIWARTVKCQSLTCGVEIPLMRQFWLAKKKNKKVFLFPYIKDGKIEFAIIDASDLSGTKFPIEEIKERLRKFLGMDEREWKAYEEEVKSKYPYYYENYLKDGVDFDPSKGTISRAKVTCPVCGYTHSDEWLRQYFRDGKAGERMVAVILTKPGEKGKRYRIATEKDVKAFEDAKKYLEEKVPKLRKEWGIEPVPNEPVRRVPVSFGVINVWVYGMNKWGDLFNNRQKLALITFVEKVREAYKKMVERGYDEEYAKAVVTYLAITLDNFAEKNNNLNRWVNNVEAIAGCFRMQALGMAWEYAEGHPFIGSISFGTLNEYKFKPLFEHAPTLQLGGKASVLQASATSLPFPDNYFDAVFTDPPYYDNVPYSYLSDFFYVWLKRSIGYLYPELFTTPLTPKSKELVAYSHNKNWEEAKRYFEEGMKQALREVYRVLKSHGIAMIVYSHKTTQGWETIINALLDSGLVPTASWPVHTELKNRFRARESAALASSIYIVARKMEKQGIGWFEEVQEELEEHLQDKLDRLWEEGISGADFFIAAIGSAIEVFGKYEKVMDYDGNEVRADRLLEFVRDFVAKYALRKILHEEISAQLSPLTKFYVLWRWSYGEARVHFDDARKLATSVGLELEEHWNRGFIRKEGEFIRVLGPQERKLEEITGNELIDVLHKVLIYWEKGMRGNMLHLLAETGWGTTEVFYKVAQAISSSLPNESREKKLIDGLLTGREAIIEAIRSGEYKSIPLETVEGSQKRGRGRPKKEKKEATLDVFGVKPKEGGE